MTPSRSHLLQTAALAVSASAVLALTACGDDALVEASPPPVASTSRITQALFSEPTLTCEVTTVHDTHAARFPCSACHGCGPQFGFMVPYTFPGGTTTAGGTLVRGTGGTPTTCTVACHYPNGAEPRAIAWNERGPLACTSCHANIAGDADRSSHLAGGATPSECRICHDASQEANGHYALPAPGGSFPDAACLGCHDGRGTTLAGRTPPLLLGWSDPVAGDWHGARVGGAKDPVSGAGAWGTLKAPYVRGQGPLPCTTCHDAHGSENAFLLASRVNGTAIPAGAIGRAGVGAEALCEACHQGARHGGCLRCHATDPSPAGDPCFWCHGHEGMAQWYPPLTKCDNCHTIVLRPVETVPPALSAMVVSDVTATTVTIGWSTDETATSYVEYGVTTADAVAGSYALVTAHAVTLTGLAPATTYLWRVRSSDEFRNVRVSSPLGTFTTLDADAVPTPEVCTVTPAAATLPSTTTVVRLMWHRVTAPSGTAVEYEVQLASDEGFTSLVNANLSRIDDTLATGNSGWIAGVASTDANGRPALGFDVRLTNLPSQCDVRPPNAYHYRVRARDQSGEVSGWSATSSFTAFTWDDWCGM